MAAVTTNTNFSDEVLNYVITYKWGIIQKESGDATLSLKNKGSNYKIVLTGKTRPWADRFYVVRDTLLATVSKTGFRPLVYKKMAHEGKNYSKDILKYSYSGREVTATCDKHKRNKHGEISDSRKEMRASGAAYDMLTIFYYLRTIDYSAFKSNMRIKTTMFSGSAAETLTLQCIGKTNVKLRNGKTKEAYHIKFTFTTGGGKKSSSDIEAWISADEQRIPLIVVGSLAIGKIKAIYVG